MNTWKSNILANHNLWFKIFIILSCTLFTVYIFPKSNRFQYDFYKGEPWEYETLYAPFSFPIEKSDAEITEEKASIKELTPAYFEKDESVKEKVLSNIQLDLRNTIIDTTRLIKFSILSLSREIANDIYTPGYIASEPVFNDQKVVALKSESGIKELFFKDLNKSEELIAIIKEKTRLLPNDLSKSLKSSILDRLAYDTFFDQVTTNKMLNDAQDKVSPTRGLVSENSRIIAQGEIVEGEKYQILQTLNNAYKSQTWTESQYYWKLLGYLSLIATAFTMLLLFVYRYRPEIYKNNRKLTFVYFNIISIIALSALVVRINAEFLYVIPVCLLPLILKAFFDARLGLFSHVIAVLIISFIVPHSDEYLFLQIMAGIATILSSSEIYKRANLFITVGQIVGIYVLGYFAFYAINQGGVAGWEWFRLGYFVLCGFTLLFVWPLIYIYEKIFYLVSDVSLLELSDTNSKLLKELSNKAPGTFHHSLNVANIAETIANEIGANSMLVRVGALYHDIGKMSNPTYFTENQGAGINPHDDLDPEESAQIIIDHTLEGIEIAKKNNLPDRIIDFIRTHHGDSLVYYFYKRAIDSGKDVNEVDFRYPGPKPFSVETAILMISDSVEAASRSLQNPTSIKLNELVDKIINKQIDEGQFLNAEITFKQIEVIKSVIKKKLASIYHLRIEYPE